MSNVNIKRAVENIRANTTVYTPVVELIVNALHAISDAGRDDGEVSVRAVRSGQAELDGALAEVESFEIEDNGVGFTQRHRDAFDTLYTDLRMGEGGKGFGRFTALKYFDALRVASTFHDGERFMSRSFEMGKDTEIIVNERVTRSDRSSTGSIVYIEGLKKPGALDKKLQTIARNLVEKLLPCFITSDYVCPRLVVSEADGSGAICLNDFVSNELSAEIREISQEVSGFSLRTSEAVEEFSVRVFQFYSPRNQKSRIGLVAHKREVSTTPLHRYVPEFEDEFYERDGVLGGERPRNFILKAYVFGAYLDRNVSLERGGFEFGPEADLTHEIGQTAIEREAAVISRAAAGEEITLRQEHKRERVQAYVDGEAPWHKAVLKDVDLSGLPLNPTAEEIETRFQQEKFRREAEIKRDISKLLAQGSLENLDESVVAIVEKISGTSRNDLIHYVALRRRLLDLFGKSLETGPSGKYSSEGVVHDIIFPRKGSTEATTFDEHNLWILDERLNFTSYVSSDIPLNGKNTERPDLLIYNKRVLFRGDNEASNPVTIFEFKKPLRDDFVNPSSVEDPVQQIVRYVNDIRDGKYTTPEGRRILVADNTPFYGYVVCDLTQKVEVWLEREKDFKRMPDRLGWFQWLSNINLYVEVLSWDKVLRDAQMRNRIFFEKLGI